MTQSDSSAPPGTSDAELPADLEPGDTVVTVNRRLARHLRERHARRQIAHGARAWPSIDVLPLDAWVRRTWAGRRDAAPSTLPFALDPGQEEALWERVIRSSPAAGSALGPRDAAAAGAARRALSLMRAWDIDPGALDGPVAEDVEAFRGWLGQFRRRMEHGGWIDAGAALDAIIADPPPARRRNGRPGKLILAGFDLITPQLARLREALREAGVPVRIWSAALEPSKRQRIECPDVERECRLAAAWARDLLDAGEPGPIGIVAVRLEPIRDRLEAALEDALAPGAVLPGRAGVPAAFNLSLGQPITAFPLAGDALHALGLTGSSIALESLGRALRSPYVLADAHEREGRLRLDLDLRDRGERRISVDRLVTLAREHGLPGLAERITAARTRVPGAASSGRPDAWAALMTGQLAALGWPGPAGLDSDDHQVMQALSEVFERLAALGPITGPIRFAEAFARVRRMAAETVFQPQSAEQAPVQALGVLEAAGHLFTRLWVIGMDDEAWPAPAEPHPLLPAGLQRRLRMPGADPEQSLDFARRVTARLLGSSAQCVVSHAPPPERETSRPSALVAGLAPVERPPGEVHGPLGPHARAIAAAAPALEAVSDGAAPPIDPDAPVRGGVRLLADQAACPFRAFAVHRLFARGADPADVPVDARERGTAVHRVLELVWSEIGSRAALAGMDAGARRQVVARAVDVVLAEASARRPESLGGRLGVLERERLARLVDEWLDVELERSDFEVLAPEREHVAHLGSMALRLRPDRVDRLPDGSLLILDYKTRAPTLAAWLGERPDEPQLPAYVTLLDAGPDGAPVAAAVLAQVRRGELILRGLGDRNDLGKGVSEPGRSRVAAVKSAGDWAGLKRIWREAVEGLAERAMGGDARVDPKSGDATCRYCDLRSLCRVDALSRRAGAGQGR